MRSWARRAKYLTTQAKDDPVEFVHREVGYNYRLTNLQAAVGVAQLERLEPALAAKRRIAAALRRGPRRHSGPHSDARASWATSVSGCTLSGRRRRFGMRPASYSARWREEASRPVRCGSRFTARPPIGGATPGLPRR